MDNVRWQLADRLAKAHHHWLASEPKLFEPLG